MTVQGAIDQVDRFRPNMVREDEKLRWLSELDQSVWVEIIRTHEPERKQPPDGERMPWPWGGVDPLGEFPRQAEPVGYPPEEEPEADDWREQLTYTDERDYSRKLLVPEPWTDVYLWWLCSKIDLVNAETEKYANDRTLFNSAWEAYSNWYTRTHMPRKIVDQFRM